MSLAMFSSKDLLAELFKRYREAVFIGNAGGMDPIHMTTHLPNSATGMHSVLAVQLNNLLSNLKRKYPDMPLSPVPATVDPCRTEEGAKDASRRVNATRELQKLV